MDNRKLKDVTMKDCVPLPRMDDTLDILAGTKWLSTLDLKSGYCQVDIHPDAKEKTAFSTSQRLWNFTVMPFGLCNAPATFKGLMETVLLGLTYYAYLVYLDDMIIIGRTFQEHLFNLRKVFERFREARLTLKTGKYQHLQKEVKYLGHIVSPEGIELSGPMHVLQAIYFQFRQHRKTADLTHGREAGIPVDSGNGGHLPNAKGSLVFCP
jgi:hypothetical protein